MYFMKYFVIISMVISICLFCSCAKEGNDMGINISQKNENIINLISTVYDDDTLKEIISIDGKIKDINKKYPIECIRKFSKIYRISYLGIEKVAILLFDYDGNKLFGKIYDTKKLKSDFSELKNGDSLKDVQNIDPNGEYLFLFTGRNDASRVSYHYARDGFVIMIEYDNNKIKSIKIQLI